MAGREGDKLESTSVATTPRRTGTKSVVLESVTKRFGDVTAVDDIDLGIEEGEFFTMLGPSGCGKTTTLRMVAGFEEPTSGRLLVDGQTLTLDQAAVALERGESPPLTPVQRRIVEEHAAARLDS